MKVRAVKEVTREKVLKSKKCRENWWRRVSTFNIMVSFIFERLVIVLVEGRKGGRAEGALIS